MGADEEHGRPQVDAGSGTFAAVLAPRDEYVQRCHALRMRVNHGVASVLPDTVDARASTRRLDFRQVCVGRNGLVPLAPVIGKFTSLTELDLRDTYVANDGVLVLCDELVGCSALQVLRLARNPISYPAGKRLEWLIGRIGGLCVVDVDATLMNPGLARRVSKAAAAKRQPAAMSAAALAAAEELAEYEAAGSPPAADQWGLTDQPMSPCSPLARESTAPVGVFRADGSSRGGSQNARQSSAACAHSPAADRNGAAAAKSYPAPPVKPVSPEDRWYALETVWAVAADASSPMTHAADGTPVPYPGLLTVLTHTRAN